MSLSGDQSNSTFGGNFSSSNSTSGDLSIQWTASTILFFVITTFTFLLGVPGNGAVVWVTGFKVKSGVHTLCFLNLAVADLIYCLVLPFLVASYFVLRRWPQDKLLWIFLLSAITLNMSASAFLLTMISIFRCLAVTRPIWSRQNLRLAWVRAACFGAWGLAFLTTLPYLLIEQIFLYFGNKVFVVLDVTWAVLIFGLPVAIMAACYILIVRELCRNQLTKSSKPVRLIVTVVAAFFVCWLPNNVCAFLQALSHAVPTEWIYFTFGLASFNSALNPLLYVFVGRDFRQVFRRSLASSIRVAFAEEGSELGGDRPDSTDNTETGSEWHTLSRTLGRAISLDDGEGGLSATTARSTFGVSPGGRPPPLHRGPGTVSVPQSLQNIDECTTGTGSSAHPDCAGHDANSN